MIYSNLSSLRKNLFFVIIICAFSVVGASSNPGDFYGNSWDATGDCEPSWDSGKGYIPQNWSYTFPDGVSGFFQSSRWVNNDTDSLFGAYSLNVTGGTLTSCAEFFHYINITEGHTYLLSVWAKRTNENWYYYDSDGTSTNRLGYDLTIEWWNVSLQHVGTSVAVMSRSWYLPKDEWTYYDNVLTAPSGMGEGAIAVIDLWWVLCNGTTLIDGIWLTDITDLSGSGGHNLNNTVYVDVNLNHTLHTCHQADTGEIFWVGGIEANVTRTSGTQYNTKTIDYLPSGVGSGSDSYVNNGAWEITVSKAIRIKEMYTDGSSAIVDLHSGLNTISDSGNISGFYFNATCEIEMFNSTTKVTDCNDNMYINLGDIQVDAPTIISTLMFNNTNNDGGCLDITLSESESELTVTPTTNNTSNTMNFTIQVTPASYADATQTLTITVSTSDSDPDETSFEIYVTFMSTPPTYVVEYLTNNSTDGFIGDVILDSTHNVYFRVIKTDLGPNNISFQSIYVDNETVYDYLSVYALYSNLTYLFKEITPKKIGELDTNGDARSIKLYGDYVYIADGNDGFKVISISDIDLPSKVGEWVSGDTTHDIDVEGELLAIADHERVRIFNITNKSDPTQLNNYDSGSITYGVDIEGDYLYVAIGVNGLTRFDISDLPNLVPSGTTDVAGVALDVFIEGNYAFVVDAYSLIIMNITEGMGDIVGSVTLRNVFGENPEDVYVSGDYAYVACGDRGLDIVNVSDVSNPVNISNYDTGGYAQSTYKEGNLCFVADGGGGIHIINITDVLNPTLIYTYDTDGSAREIYVESNIMYIVDGPNGFEAVSLSTELRYDVVFPPMNYFDLNYTVSVWLNPDETYGAIDNSSCINFSIMSSTPRLGVNLSCDFVNKLLDTEYNITITFEKTDLGPNNLIVDNWTSNHSYYYSKSPLSVYISAVQGATNTTYVFFNASSYLDTNLTGLITWNCTGLGELYGLIDVNTTLLTGYSSTPLLANLVFSYNNSSQNLPMDNITFGLDLNHTNLNHLQIKSYIWTLDSQEDVTTNFTHRYLIPNIQNSTYSIVYIHRDDVSYDTHTLPCVLTFWGVGSQQNSNLFNLTLLISFSMVNFSYKYPILTKFEDCQVGTRYTTTWTLYNAYNPAGSAYTFVAYNYTINETDVDSGTIDNLVNNVSTYHVVDLNNQYNLRFYSETRQAQIKFYLREYGDADLELDINGNTQTVSSITTTWAIYQIYTQYLVEGWNDIEIKLSGSSGNEVWIRNATVNSNLIWQRLDVGVGDYENRSDSIAIDIWMADLIFYEEKNVTITGGNSNTWNVYFYPTEFNLSMNRITMILQDQEGRYLDNLTFIIKVSKYQYAYYVLDAIRIKAMENDSFAFVMGADEETEIGSIEISVSWIDTVVSYDETVINANSDITINFSTLSPYQEDEEVSYSITISITTDVQNNSYTLTIIATRTPRLVCDLDDHAESIKVGEEDEILFVIENAGYWEETYTITLTHDEYHTSDMSVSDGNYSSTSIMVTLGVGESKTITFSYLSSIEGEDIVSINITDSNGTIVHSAEIAYTIEGVDLGYNKILSYIMLIGAIVGTVMMAIYVNRNEELQEEIRSNTTKYVAVFCLLLVLFIIILSYSGIIRIKMPLTNTKMGW